jgi:hypothetical protein
MPNDFLEIKSTYERLGFSITNVRHHEESNEYSACGFLLNNKEIEFRTGKITPTKPEKTFRPVHFPQIRLS